MPGSLEFHKSSGTTLPDILHRRSSHHHRSFATLAGTARFQPMVCSCCRTFIGEDNTSRRPMVHSHQMVEEVPLVELSLATRQLAIRDTGVCAQQCHGCPRNGGAISCHYNYISGFDTHSRVCPDSRAESASPPATPESRTHPRPSV
eukprot:SAG31_NODE_4228_length_3442_cov_2.372719_5_plen_147_part_00